MLSDLPIFLSNLPFSNIICVFLIFFSLVFDFFCILEFIRLFRILFKNRKDRDD